MTSKESIDKYYGTEKGVATKIYNHQICSARRRGHNPPAYSKEDFRTWLFSQPDFKILYDNWVTAGRVKELKPSVDRIDDNKSYSFDNIQLMTWRENWEKGNKAHIHKLTAAGNEYTSKVLSGEVIPSYQKAVKCTKDGMVTEYRSAAHASRETGVSKSSVLRRCTGESKSSINGFNFIYK